MGHRAGSEEVVDGVMDASSVYVASIFFKYAYTGGNCSHTSGTPYALLLPDAEVRLDEHVSVKGLLGPPSGRLQ